MSWYDRAVRMELPENRTQAKIKPTQVIYHSIAAPWTAKRTFEYWRDSTNLESHFGLAFDGTLAQYMSSEVRADANNKANVRAISLESASNLNHTDPWTLEQLYKLIDVGVWAVVTHGIPARKPERWDSPGIGYHRLFSEWSVSGTACPGDARVDQFNKEVLPEIQRHTGNGGGTPPTRPSIDLSRLIQAAKSDPPKSGTPVSYSGAGTVEDALRKEGLLAANLVDGHYGSSTVSAYAAWQRRLGYNGSDADGIPGNSSLTRLGNKHGFAVVA